MSLNFFRRVAFGLSPSDKMPDDPLPWALNQLNNVPDLLWPGSIPAEKELRKKYGEWVYGDREVLRKKFKNDKNKYKKAKKRFKFLGSGAIKRTHSHLRHILTKKTTKQSKDGKCCRQSKHNVVVCPN